MKNHLKLSIFLAINILLFYVNIMSCGPMAIDWNSNRFSFFFESLISDKEISQEFYTNARYGGVAREAKLSQQKEDIIKEWKAFISDGGLKKEIRSILFERENKDWYKYDWQNSTAKILPMALVNLDKYKKYFMTGKNKYVREYLEYVRYKNQQEAIAVLGSDHYYYSSVEIDDSQKRSSTIDFGSALEQYALNPDVPEFIQRKFAYQAVKSFYKEENFHKATDLYRKFFLNYKKYDMATVYASEYYGKALYKQGNKVEALSVFLDLLENYPIFYGDVFLTRYIMTNFDRQIHEEYRKSVKDKIKQANSFFVESNGMNATGLLNTEPNSIRTKMVALKNCTLMYPVWYGVAGGGENNEGAEYMKKSAAEIKNTIKSALKNNKITEDSGLWMLMAAYLSIINGETKEADALLEKSGTSISKNKTIKLQYDIVRLLNGFAKESKISSDLQENVARVYEELSKIPEAENISDSIMRLAGLRFLEAKDYYRAGLCFMAGDFSVMGDLYIDAIATPENILKSYEKPEKIDKMFKDSIFYDKDYVYYIISMKYIKLKKYDKAFNMAKKISSSFWTSKRTIKRWPYCGLCNKSFNFKNYLSPVSDETKLAYLNLDILGNAEAKRVTKIKVMEALNELSSLSNDKNPEKSAMALYKMASIYLSDRQLAFTDILWGGSQMSDAVWYNWGKELEFGQTIWFLDKLLPVQKRKEIAEELYVSYNSNAIGKKYLEESLQKLQKAKSDPEFQAKIYILIQECGLKEYKGYIWDMPAAKDGNYEFIQLRQFKELYQATNYYKEYYSKCSWLRNAVDPVTSTAEAN